MEPRFAKQTALIALVALMLGCSGSGVEPPADGAIDLAGSDAFDLAGGRDACAPTPPPDDGKVSCNGVTCTAGAQACCLAGPQAGGCIDPAQMTCGPPGEIQCSRPSHCAAVAGAPHCCLIVTGASLDESTCPASLQVMYGGDQRCAAAACQLEICVTDGDCASGRCLATTFGVGLCG